MPSEAPRPGEQLSSRESKMHTPPRPPDQAHLLEELAQVEYQLEALAAYRKQLRETLGQATDDTREVRGA